MYFLWVSIVLSNLDTYSRVVSSRYANDIPIEIFVSLKCDEEYFRIIKK